MTSNDQLLNDFAALFRGLERAHGTYRVSGVITEKGKRDGRGTTLTEPVTLAHYARHLRGEYMLGVVPIMDDGNVWFAALDVDKYGGEYMQLVEAIRDANLPLVPVLSKSNGVHLYLFFTEPVPAELARRRLNERAQFLGVGGCEVFPKQDVLTSKDEIGNWLNLSYYKGLLGAQHAERLMVDPRSGEKVADLSKFLAVAQRMRITRAQLEDVKAKTPARAPRDFSDGPPCLQHLAAQRISEGGRNNAMYQFAVYWREKGKTSSTHVDLLAAMRTTNTRFFDPPLTDAEVVGVHKSVLRDKGFYKCKDQPMQSHCDRAVCLRRKFGVGTSLRDANTHLEYGGLTKYEIRDDGGEQSTQEEPWYDLTINGRSLRFAADELYNVELFRQRVAKVLNVFPASMKKPDWESFLNHCFETQQVVAVPFEAGPKGQLIGHVRDFVRDFGQREDWDALLDGGAYIDRKNGVAHFRWQDLLSYLNRKNVRGLKQADVFAVLQGYMGARNGEKKISAKHTRYWAVSIQVTDMPPSEELVHEY